ncbi:MAG: hypothetical protein WC284_08465 [Candidimonas sp.]
MNDESRLILEIWDVFKEHVDKKKRVDVIFSFFKVLEDHGIYIEDNLEIRGEDSSIDAALADYLEEDDPHDDEDDEDY